MAEASSRSSPSGSWGRRGLVLDDPDVVEVSAEAVAGWSSSGRQKRKLSQFLVLDFDALFTLVRHHEIDYFEKFLVVRCCIVGLATSPDIIELDSDDDPDEVTIIGENISNQKNKQAFVHMEFLELAKLQSGMSAILAGPSITPPTNVLPFGGLGGYHNNASGPSSTPATNFNPWDVLGAYHGGAVVPPIYSHQFVHVGAPGEDNNKYYSNGTSLMEIGSRSNPGANNYIGIPPGVGTILPSEHMTSAEMSRQSSQTVVNSEIDEKYKKFKQFDTVSDHSDNFYALPCQRVRAVKKPSKAWVKRIQHEWKVLETDLPDTIYVRVYEDRMDLLRAVIVGPAGTPYHDGLFFFDIYFPSQYPIKPPLVNYRSGGLRLNPNLYQCGKVCLSLLNTWAGSGCETWNPSNSTMLQVLVSIQALVLNAKPYFNEPGYAVYANTPQGEKLSMAYNEETFLLSCKTMLYSLRNPPKHFQDFIVGHFLNCGHKILKGCKSYMAGVQVGCLVGDGVQDVDEGDKSCSDKFKGSLKLVFEDLVKEFANIGVNCDGFRNPESTEAKADTTLKL
ncbi:hypothetical protein U9M48_018100 [Paspalum notatum var. saurae]|uniref:E2 ubiquitin-conjugating enzyme n=1 Tax=Paspalum notatum var. saurae TaxID=547442 RepID=A0AAQ3TAT7_PASNO